MRQTLTIYSLFIVLSAQAQWHDSFDQGRLHPDWNGSVQDFIINSSQQLQLMSATEGSSSLHRKIDYADTMQWSFFIKMSFAPSSANRLRLALMLNRPDSLILATGYSFEVGETGNEDRWKLKAINMAQGVILAEGEMGKLAGDPAFGRFRITRYPDSSWTIESDYTGRHSFSLEKKIKDSLFYNISDPWFGLECIYTSTRTDKFFFDDIIIGKTKGDTLAPFIKTLDSIASNAIWIQFNEKLHAPPALDKNNFFIPGIGNPINIEFSTQDSTQLKLLFTKTFTSGLSYTLEYTNIEDLFGNKGIKQIFHFDFFQSRTPSFQEIIITEIMADPSPVVGLPEAEYIELYNNSAVSLSLDQCKLSDASVQLAIPSATILPGEYLIVCSPADTALFKTYGKVLAIPNFFSLNNTGDLLLLYNLKNELIFRVNYSDSWYRSTKKKEGGYSLEMINTNELCTGFANWIASENILGGTPGQKNSVAKNTQDTQALQLLELVPLSEWEVQLVFNKSIDPNVITQFQNFSISPSRSIASIEQLTNAQNTLIFLLDQPLEKGTIYSFHIKSITDCSGKAGEETITEFTLPADPKPGDILINEVLFNPIAFGVDYIELANTSTQSLTTSHLFFRNILEDTRWIPIGKDKLIKPGNVLALSTDPFKTIQHYPFGDIKNIAETEIPPMADAEFSIVIASYINNSFLVLDSVYMLDDWHHPLLASKEGVALERVTWKGKSTDNKNWQSASGQYRYGTPGAKNSQFLDTLANIDKPYSLNNSYITPNLDGINDEFIIRFNLDKGGYKISAEAFDLNGYKVKSISTVLLAPQDFITWDGIDDNLRIAKAGNYILYMELVHPDGSKMRYKERLSISY